VLLEVLFILCQRGLALRELTLLLSIFLLNASDGFILLLDKLGGLVKIGLGFGELQQELLDLLLGGVGLFY
jgi:hypothetical protein